MTTSVTKTALAATGGVVAAVVSTLCCVGPLVAVALGLSGAGLAAMFEPLRPYFVAGTVLAPASPHCAARRSRSRAPARYPLRPYFVAGTVLALGFGFVVLRSEEKRACEPDTLCASPIARRRMKWALWTATILSIPLLTFPWWSKFLLS